LKSRKRMLAYGPVKHVAALLDWARDRLKWKRNVLPDAAIRPL
jgi:hypothetical protein